MRKKEDVPIKSKFVLRWLLSWVESWIKQCFGSTWHGDILTYISDIVSLKYLQNRTQMQDLYSQQQTNMCSEATVLTKSH